MFYYIPTKIYEDNNCVSKHAMELATFGNKALIVTGKHSSAINGSLADVEEALSVHGISYAVFNEIEENPSVETIMKARDFGLKEKADFIIGLGGGSAMDAAKAISLMIRHSSDNVSYLYNSEAETSVLPIVVIPTTCGTGSEVTGSSILTRHDMATKQSISHKIFPDLALLDWKYLSTAPAKVLANTTMDAFAHLAESYINTDASIFSRSFALTGLRLWSLSKDTILNKAASSEKCLRNMLLTSTYAGMAIAHTGTSIPHGLSYALTYNTGMAHGKACGFFLAGYLREANEDDALTVLNTAGFSSVEDFENYYEATCGRDTVDNQILELSVNDLLAHPGKMKKAPFTVDEAVLRRIIFE